MIKKSWTNFEKSPEAKNSKIPVDLLELSCLDEIFGGGGCSAKTTVIQMKSFDEAVNQTLDELPQSLLPPTEAEGA